ncbi:MAG: ATP-binding cassette domain-containing protein [Cyanobacteria bacterium P01_E01_bin.6]
MIEVNGVSHRFGDRLVLNAITLKLTERRIGIVGSNGSGKTTFARLLNGLIVPTKGHVMVDGLDTQQSVKAVRRTVGFVFQNPDNQIVFPTVEEDLAFGLRNLRRPAHDIQQRVDWALQQYGLDQHRHHPAHLLSGGQKQLLAIASVVVMDPAYIVFDEPTTLLDLRNRNHIRTVLEQLTQTIIVVSHDLELLNDFDRVLVFDQGSVVLDDVPSRAVPYYVELMTK